MLWRRRQTCFEDVFDVFIERKSAKNRRGKPLSVHTIRGYRKTVKGLVRFLDQKCIERITETDILRFISHLRETQQASSVELRYRQLICLFTDLVKMEVLKISPVAKIKISWPKKQPKEAQRLAYLRESFLAVCRDDRDELLTMVMSYTGARVGEIAQMQWSHIGEREGAAFIVIGSNELETRTKTGERMMPLHDNLREFLKQSQNGSRYFVYNKEDHSKGICSMHVILRVQKMAERADIEATCHSDERLSPIFSIRRSISTQSANGWA